MLVKLFLFLFVVVFPPITLLHYANKVRNSDSILWHVFFLFCKSTE